MISDCWAIMMYLPGPQKWQVYKIYNDDSHKTLIRARKKRRELRKEFGRQFKIEKIGVSDDLVKEHTHDEIEKIAEEINERVGRPRREGGTEGRSVGLGRGRGVVYGIDWARFPDEADQISKEDWERFRREFIDPRFEAKEIQTWEEEGGPAREDD